MKKQENTATDMVVGWLMAPIRKMKQQISKLDEATRKDVTGYLGVGGLMAGVGFWEVASEGIWMALLFVCIIGLVTYCLCHRKISRFEDARAAEKTSYAIKIRFNEETHTLSITQRGSVLRQFIDLKPVYDYYNTYVPEKIHIGAVTVGGVTSGGIYKTGGYSAVNIEKKEGYCKLEYYASGKTKSSEIVRRIQLTDELYKEAQNSPIAKYLDSKNKQIIVEDDVKMSNAETEQLLHGLATQTYDSRKFQSGYPTYEKGRAIERWLYKAGPSWEEQYAELRKQLKEGVITQEQYEQGFSDLMK